MSDTTSTPVPVPEDATSAPLQDVSLSTSGDNDLVTMHAETSGDEDEEDISSEDSLTFSNGVIEKIVAIAMRDVPDVIGMKGSWLNRVQDALGASDSRKGVTVEVTSDSSVRVNVSVLIKYGSYAPQVFEDVKKAVVKEVTGMTGLSVAGVNLRIEDVLTPEEYAAESDPVADEDEAESPGVEA